MLVEGVEQLTPEWLHMRCGIVTASRMADVVAKLKRKDGEAACRLNYKKELVYEVLTGRAWEHYVTPAMEAGIDNEPLARAAYEIANDVEVVQGGFFLHDRIARLGASPDGLVGDDGLIEIKCPTTATHLDTLVSGEIPDEYTWQMLTEMACSGRQWCDFVSFDARLPKRFQMFVKRFPRDEKLISALEIETLQFLEEVCQYIERLPK